MVEVINGKPWKYMIVRRVKTVEEAKVPANWTGPWQPIRPSNMQKWIGTCWVAELFDGPHEAFLMDDGDL